MNRIGAPLALLLAAVIGVGCRAAAPVRGAEPDGPTRVKDPAFRAYFPGAVEQKVRGGDAGCGGAPVRTFVSMDEPLRRAYRVDVMASDCEALPPVQRAVVVELLAAVGADRLMPGSSGVDADGAIRSFALVLSEGRVVAALFGWQRRSGPVSISAYVIEGADPEGQKRAMDFLEKLAGSLD